MILGTPLIEYSNKIFWNKLRLWKSKRLKRETVPSLLILIDALWRSRRKNQTDEHNGVDDEHQVLIHETDYLRGA